MTQRTVELSDFDSYLEYEYPLSASAQVDGRNTEIADRELRRETFPHTLILKVAYPELDYANRWCWREFGPTHGKCFESQSTYPACEVSNTHSHDGRWMWHWLAK